MRCQNVGSMLSASVVLVATVCSSVDIKSRQGVWKCCTYAASAACDGPGCLAAVRVSQNEAAQEAAYRCCLDGRKMFVAEPSRLGGNDDAAHPEPREGAKVRAAHSESRAGKRNDSVDRSCAEAAPREGNWPGHRRAARALHQAYCFVPHCGPLHAAEERAAVLGPLAFSIYCSGVWRLARRRQPTSRQPWQGASIGRSDIESPSV